MNRMDFFRLFKALAANHACDHFILFELTGGEQPLDLYGGHALHNVSEAHVVAETGAISRTDPLVAHLMMSTAARAFEAGTCDTPLLDSGNASSAVAVPLHTATGKRFGLILLRRNTKPEHPELALIAHDAAQVFQRYFEVIISLDSVSGLSDREIQIVRWTSEGKTSSEIAIILSLSEHTVNSYIAAILRKLHVVNRAQMVAAALRNGLIT
ncbi:response regulator transcription factor [Hoeflea sp.]|uniref:helix-turn-helix transcriptional regulator n=1 Tax=Hoeflea sp. TaxID=1940281 RepID=UPI003BA84D17